MAEKKVTLSKRLYWIMGRKIYRQRG